MQGGNVVTAILFLIIGVAVMVGVFLLIRSIILWYWKIDSIVENQETQIQLLTRQNELLEDVVKNLNRD